MRRLIAVAIALIALPLLAAPVAAAAKSPLAFTPGVVAFGHVPVGTTAQEAVALTNTSDETMSVIGYEVFAEGPSFNGNFNLNPGDCQLLITLGPGEGCTFAIVTSPKAAGPLHGGFCYTVAGATTTDRLCGRIVGAAS